jgi:hypothetical protein
MRVCERIGQIIKEFSELPVLLPGLRLSFAKIFSGVFALRVLITIEKIILDPHRSTSVGILS